MRWHTLSVDKKILLIVSFGFFLVGAISSVYYFLTEKQYTDRLLLKQSRTLFGQLQIIRHWNADHGGLYAYLKPGEKPNPYLYKTGPGEGKKSGIEPEIQDQKGLKLGLINPAIMTRELSIESARLTDIRFHLTSLQLINPNNAPDEFEKNSLHAFNQGVAYQTQYADFDGKPYFRYMAPLFIESACLGCHGFQNYKVGDIRGGISISIPMSEELAVLRHNQTTTISIGLLVYLCVISLLIFAIRRFVSRPIKELAYMAKHVGSGDILPSTLLKYGDEIGVLSRTLIASDKELRLRQKELEELAKTAEERSRIDALTQIHNRHHLYLEAPQLFAQAVRKNQPICVLMIDIDYFKKINDSHGHKIGDDALKLVASIIRPEIRSYDLFIRFGGEEFLLVLADTPVQEGLQMAERIRQRIESSRLQVDNANTIPLHVSIGLYCSAKATLDKAIIHADEALYEAKAKGRNQVCIFEE